MTKHWKGLNYKLNSEQQNFSVESSLRVRPDLLSCHLSGHKLLTMTELTIKHVVCRITSTSYHISSNRLVICV